MTEKIIKIYEKTGSIRATAKELGCSWNRVTKALSTAGFVVSETHMMILELHDEGLTAEEIAKKTGYNIKTVKAYLPRVRPEYGEYASENAKRIKKSREKQKG